MILVYDFFWKGTNVSQEIHSTDCIQKELNVDIKEANLGNFKNREERLSVDATYIRANISSYRSRDLFILNCGSDSA